LHRGFLSKALHPQLPKFIFFKADIYTSIELNTLNSFKNKMWQTRAPQSSLSSPSFMQSGKARPAVVHDVYGMA
jgi:hypothetical protein